MIRFVIFTLLLCNFKEIKLADSLIIQRKEYVPSLRLSNRFNQILKCCGKSLIGNRWMAIKKWSRWNIHRSESVFGRALRRN